MTETDKCKEDIIYFAENYLKDNDEIKLYDFQKKIIEKWTKRIFDSCENLAIILTQK